jgi:hypothetical protein
MKLVSLLLAVVFAAEDGCEKLSEDQCGEDIRCSWCFTEDPIGSQCHNVSVGW